MLTGLRNKLRVTNPHALVSYSLSSYWVSTILAYKSV